MEKFRKIQTAGILSCLVFCFCVNAMGKPTDNGIFPFPIHQDKLPNGLQVVTVPFDSPGLVAYATLVRVGSRDEVEEGKTGFAHFFEHCMFRGTEKYSQTQYDKILQELAASGNADTWYDRTFYYFTGNAARLEKMFEIEADRFRYLKYSEHGFKTEAGAVLGEYTKNFSSPYRRYMEKLQSVAFTEHTYGHTTMGYLADIKDMPNQYDYSLSFYNRFYRPEYCTLIISGDVTHEKVMALAKKYYGDWERGDHVPKVPTEPKQTEPRSGHVTVDGETNYVGIFYKSPPFSDKDDEKLALDLLLDLSFSSNSDIYKQLVRNEQKVRSFNLIDTDTRDPFVSGVFASLFKVEDTAYVREEMFKTFKTMRETRVSEEKLDNLKSRRKYMMARSLSTPISVADALAGFVWLTGDPNSLNRYYKMMDGITPEKLQAAAQKYIMDETRVMVTLSAEENGR